jgi:hypothetical protein
MLQVFQFDVANVDRDVAHIAITTHLFQVYVLNVSSVFLDVYLQMFHFDVAYVFVSVLDVCSKRFSYFRMYVASIFIWMF